MPNWEMNYKALQAFHSREGHCRVPAKYVEGEVDLGAWVIAQRRSRGQLSPDQIERLEATDMAWDIVDPINEAGYRALQEFYFREGHCRVPARHVENEFRLGQWVRAQRQNKSKLSADRVERLEALGFEWKA
jgi:hypothetical protein